VVDGLVTPPPPPTFLEGSGAGGGGLQVSEGHRWTFEERQLHVPGMRDARLSEESF